MSVKSAALRALVLERLAVAADEIFALFERTFAQYEEEVLRSKLLQAEPRDVLYKEEIQTVTVGVNSDEVIKEEPIKIKQEVNAPIELQCPSATLKSEEPDGAEEQRPASTGEQRDAEEPGCSSGRILDDNGQPYSCSDTEDSEDWEFVVDQTTQNPEQEKNASLEKDSAGNDVSCDDRSDAVTSNDEEHRDVLHRCSQCDGTFTDVEALDAHLEIHPGPFTCQLCHKNYYFKRAYQRHLRSHADKKPFGCSVCTRRFSQKRHMDEHMRTHTGETPFSCSDCGRKFRQRNSLMRHILTKHSEDKPYRCSVCQRGFVQKWHFVVHMRGHTGERPFGCSVCGQSYEIKYYLDRHMRSHKVQAEITSEMAE